MSKTKTKNLISLENIETKIFLIRGRKVMFDRDLATLYGVETRTLNQTVKRNIDRFPEDFMFQLNKQESDIFSRYQIGTLNYTLSRSQVVILKKGQNIKYTPYVFTEQGVAMLSSVLRSQRAIQVNIQIMRTFVKIKEMIISNKALREKIEEMEKKYDGKFAAVFKVISKLIGKPSKEKYNKIGFEVK